MIRSPLSRSLPYAQDLNDLANPKVTRQEKKKAAPPRAVPSLPSYVIKPGNFEDVVEQVATNLRTKIADIDSPEANDIVRCALS